MLTNEEREMTMQDTEMWTLFQNIVKRYKLLEEHVITEEDMALLKDWNMMTSPSRKMQDILLVVKRAKSI